MIGKKQYNKYYKQYKTMWNFLSKHPEISSVDYFKKAFNHPPTWTTGYEQNFACVVVNGSGLFVCEVCPLTERCITKFKEYCKNYVKQNDLISDSALQLANIPWLDYEEWVEIVHDYKRRI